MHTARDCSGPRSPQTYRGVFVFAFYRLARELGILLLILVDFFVLQLLLVQGRFERGGRKVVDVAVRALRGAVARVPDPALARCTCWRPAPRPPRAASRRPRTLCRRSSSSFSIAFSSRAATMAFSSRRASRRSNFFLMGTSIVLSVRPCPATRACAHDRRVGVSKAGVCAAGHCRALPTWT